MTKITSKSPKQTIPDGDDRAPSKRQARPRRPGAAAHADTAAPTGATSGKVRKREVRTRERSSTNAKSPQNVAELHRLLHEAVTVGDQLDTLIELGLTDFDLQKLTNRSRTAIYAWRRGTALPPAEIAEIIDNTRYAAASLLSPHVPFTAAGLLAWLRARSKGLQGRRPLDALAEGEFQTVVDAGRRWVGADPPGPESKHDDESRAMARATTSD